MKTMRKQLIKLLNIHGVSKEEGKVRDYLKQVLPNLMDSVEVDSYGNLLGVKKVGNGHGATVLLSAHMDTVKGVLADRKLIEKNGVFSSDKGALGGDDRAGIAVILEVLRSIDKLSFDGVVKVAFSTEEEIGCIGSSKIDEDFYSDADLAIVVDRRGNRDIVVGCWEAFCCNEVGEFFEEVSQMQNMDWKCVEGGISDATTFSYANVNSVNLSVGYRNEHTDKEYLVFEDMKDTVRLILQAFGVVNHFYHTFGDVPKNNKWVDTTGYGKYEKYYNQGYYYEDEVDGSLYAQVEDISGDVLVYEIGRDVVIQQGDNEVILSRDALKSLISQLKVSI